MGLHAARFERAPPERIGLEPIALDRSATHAGGGGLGAGGGQTHLLCRAGLEPATLGS